MNTLIWTYEKHSEAAAQYRALVSRGCRAKMWLAYSGEGWKVAAANA
jgi:hypothetical protein